MNVSLAALLLTSDAFPPLTGILTVSILVLTIAAFAGLWIYIFVITGKSKGPAPPVFNDAIQYLVPTLTGLVGGVVAMVFGVTLSTPPHSLQTTSIVFKPSTRIYGAYVITYLVLGMTSGVLWVSRNDVAPPLVKNFAMATVGLLVAVVSASFGFSRS